MDSEIECCSEIFQTLCQIVGNEEKIEFNRFCSDFFDSCLSSRHRAMFSWKIFFPFFYINIISLISTESLKEGKKTLTELSSEEPLHGLIDFLIDCVPNYMEHLQRLQMCMSGSRAEGFDFESSDYDIMYIDKSYKIINPAQEFHQRISDNIALVVEMNRPGYVRLRGLLDTGFIFVNNQLLFTIKDQHLYLSCEKVKEFYSLFFQWKIHGPSVSDPDGTMDHVLALSSDTWPHEAVGCLHRLLKCGWPSNVVIREMVKDGCLFVPIGCKTSPYEDIEWRMSFSLAEKRLVHSMNHTQFLTYALLKIFLKEVIEREDALKNLLCSYFMKTLVLWEIVDTKIPWSPSFLLRHFWNCFRRLLSWINNEHCPNFFVPENNMFYGKVYGHNRQTLSQFLSMLYRCEDFLLRIPSLRCKPRIVKCGSTKGKTRNNVLRRSIIIDKLIDNIGFDISFKGVSKLLDFSHFPIVSEFCHYLRLSWFNILYSRNLCRQVISICDNRTKYIKEKAMLRLIKGSSPDYVQSKIFLAIYFYKCKRYKNCYDLLTKVRKKICDKEIIYTWAFDTKKYSSLGGDVMNIPNGMYKYCLSYIPLDSCTSIPEISAECDNSYNIEESQLVSPLVLTRFLVFLCHFRRGNILRAHRHMTILENELLRSKGFHIPNITKPISWQILGICQEIIGDYQNALISYTKCEECIPICFYVRNLSLLDVNKKRKANVISLMSE